MMFFRRKDELDPTPEIVGFVVLAFVVFVMALLDGCGGGVIQTHARAALAVSSASNVAYVAMRSARSADLDACTNTTCLDEREARWAPVVTAYNAVVAAIESWVTSLEVARLVDEDDTQVRHVLTTIANGVIRAYETMIVALRQFNIEIPSLSELFRSLGISVEESD